MSCPSTPVADQAADPTGSPTSGPAPGPAGPGDTCLELDHVSVVYGQGAVGLRDVSLSCAPGTITALVGANGAGKTTLLRSVSGFLRADRVRQRGEVRLFGRSIAGSSPSSIARNGIAIVPEREKVFATLTVAENLRCVPCRRRDERARQAMEARILELFPVLAERRGQLAGLLSGGEKQMLGIARALMLRPKVLLADELSLGIAPFLVPILLRSLATIRDELGTTILLVEQSVRAAFEVADRAYVLEGGSIVAQGTPAELTGRADFNAVYFGSAPGGQGDDA
ncbi:MAG: ABC transporter ATP-binding protein [Acidimicrobiia bacterium]